MENNESIQTPKKKSSLSVLILILVLAVVGVGGYFVAQKFIGSKTPKEIFISSIEKTVKKTSNIKEKSYNTLSDEFSVKVKVSSLLLDDELLNIINNLGFKGKIGLDKKNETFYADLNATYKQEDLVKLKTYLKDNDVYMMFSDVLDKWIKVDVTNVEGITNGDPNYQPRDYVALEKLIGEALSVFKKSINDKYFVKEKVDDGYSVSLTIDSNNVKDIMSSWANGLKKSSDYKKYYKEFTGQEMTDEQLDTLVSGFNNVTGDGKIVFTVYTNSKGELTKLDIAMVSSGVDYTFSFEIPDDDTIEFAVKSQGIKMFSGSYTAKENNGKATVVLKLSMMEMISIEIDVEEEIKYDVELDKIDVSNSITAEQLTQDENINLDDLFNTKGMDKLLDDLEKIDFSEMFGSLGLGDETTSFSSNID